MSDKPPDWSLKKEMQKRKTQEIIRGVEQKRISQAMAPVPSPSDKDGQPPKTSTGEAKRATSTIPAAKSGTGELKRASQAIPAAKTATGEAKRATQISQAARRATSTIPIPSASEMSGKARRRLLPVLIGVLVMLIIALGLGISAGGLKVATPTPTLVRLPIVRAQDTVDYLTRVGVTITNLTTYPAPNQTWRASQEIQFDIQNADGKGTFLVLSYPSLSGAVSDSVRAARDAKYKTWTRALYGSVIVLSPPESAGSINNMVASHVSHFILAPYLRFIPTATPTPAPATEPVQSATPASQ